MYQDFFSLKEAPFSISPDPDFLFLSERHKEALAHLTYGLQGNGGFVLLTGEVGTGKTTVCRALLQDLPASIDIAFILNPALTEIELLATICDEFKIAYRKQDLSLKLLFDALTTWMMSNLLSGRGAIVLIDEAQHLSFSVLEQLRLLTNIESNNKKPLQVILIGQTELQQKLKQTELRQLAQRITARYHLLPLTQQESEYYIQHRLHVAGVKFPIFDASALRQIFKKSQGIPRLINLLSDRSLLAAYTQNALKVNAKMVKNAAQEMALEETHSNFSTFFKGTWRLLLLLLLILISAFQAPKILAQFSVKEAPITELKTIQETNKQEGSEQLDWFDAYPQLDLSKVEFSHALKTLYAIWGYQVDLQSANCEQGSAVSLLCFSESSNIDKLKQLNYPAVIKLINGEKQLYVVIYKASENYQLLIEDQSIEVSEAWLKHYWNGGLTLLWKTPFALQRTLQFGQKSEEIRWLVNQLNTLQGLPAENKDRFDLPLLQQVTLFQREQGLQDDGIVGTRTLMPLMQLINPMLPRLTDGEE
ncbi:AAA family ATPase [Psychromonas antarctica]|jgi:general secretion pathway protein A|uniref:AAA family ATPase n=1 Tax=Psychromonas antarctica TaxID=67573 RepID=UPI001EE79E4D|nr:AAA family ATPase [Psychromonas antarctica]MCG6200683.1 AAA family ATPase [Psychromonas antarctica]